MTAEATRKGDTHAKGMLDGLTVHPQESYSNVIARPARRAYDPEPLAPEEIAGLEEALADIRAGRLHSETAIVRTYGVE